MYDVSTPDFATQKFTDEKSGLKRFEVGLKLRVKSPKGRLISKIILVSSNSSFVFWKHHRLERNITTLSAL